MPATPLASALATSSATRGGVLAAAELVPEALDVEAELLRVAREVGRRQLVLVLEQLVVHLPEGALRGRGLGRLGRHLRVRVHVVEREVAPDVAELVAERVEQLADDDLGLPAVRALVVAVLDERDRRVLRAADVVALGIDVVGEVEQLVGGAGDLTCPHRRRAAARSTRNTTQARSDASTRCREHAELRLLELLPVEGEARDQQRDGEPDAGDGPASERSPASSAPGAARRARAARRATTHRGCRAACRPRSRTGFPASSASVTASPSSCPSMWMPAFASANSGTITKLVHG